MVESQNPYAAPQADLAPPPGTEWLQGVSPSLTKTGLGLSLVYYGIVIVLLAALVCGVSIPITASNQEAGEMMTGFASLGMAFGSLLMLLGPMICLSAPAESGGKGFVIGSVLLQFPAVVQVLVHQLAPQILPLAVILPLWVTIVAQVLGWIGFVLFVLFLRKLAHYVGREDFSRRARNVLIGLAKLCVVGTVFAVVSYAEIFVVGIFFGLSLVLGGLIVFVMYANLVNDLRKTLAGK